MRALPDIQEICDSPSSANSPLAAALEILFEPSPVLRELLEPQLAPILKTLEDLPSYTDLIDLSLAQIAKWDFCRQAEFIAGHPRIGQCKNLSPLSAKEQGGGSSPTPPAVLARLAHLNDLYEAVYPGLRYITFVNGRHRAEIVKEMEDVLKIEHSLSSNVPPVATFAREPAENMSGESISELRRAVQEVGRIAKSRLAALYR